MASLEFDEEVNVLYIRLGRGKVRRSEPICDNVVIDIDEKGEVLGVEIWLPPDIDEELRRWLAGICRRAHVTVK